MGSYLVTAVVSTYKSEKFIRGCLEDLEAQTIADSLEIIVIDSNSPEGEGEIVKEFQKRYSNIKYIRTPERESMYKAWNRAIRIASGEYITNANTDDRHREDAFEVMARALEEHPEVALVYGDCLITTRPNETFDQNSAHAMFRWWDWDRNWLLDYACFMGPQPMWRKKVHKVYGYFDESLKQSGDYEFWLRISQTFDFYHIPEILGLYFQNPKGVEHSDHKNRDEENARIWALYRRAADEGRIVRCPLLEKLKSGIFTPEVELLVPLNEEQKKLHPTALAEYVEKTALERSSWWRKREGGRTAPPPRGTVFTVS